MLSRSVHKDGDDRILAKKMSQELDALLTEAGYDCITTTGHHFVQGAYDPNNQGASDTSRAFISLPLKVLDYIKT